MNVEIRDDFWAPKRETNRLASIPISLEKLEEAGNIENMRLAAKGLTNGFRGPVFMDSDIYKAMEGAAYSLAQHPDPALDKRLDSIIEVLAGAQQSDGYLDSYFIVKAPGKRWTNLRDWHELYCAGHLVEAAVAHYQATGKTNLLNVACRLADHIYSTFGAPPKRLGYCGHPEVELALVKLWRATGNAHYFELARFFIESRGQHFFASEHNTPPEKYDGTYWQDDVPICDHENIKGHAVRAGYLMSGTTEVATQTGDAKLLAMLNRVWRNTVEKNEYLTGGIGPSAHNEGFTVDYDLPNLTAYQETCATVALAQWGDRMARLYGDAQYADVVERALYNGVISGVSLDGTKFFYVNPLESNGSHHRSAWFSCACCPPNVTRTLASLGGYAYATAPDALYVNLYIQGKVQAKLGKTTLPLTVTTDYPWDGKILLQPEPAAPTKVALHLRIPAWCHEAEVSVDGEPIKDPVRENGYLVLDREWKHGDKVQLDLAMPIEKVLANPNVKADRSLVALQRGPIVYCVEACDQPEPLASMYLPVESELTSRREQGAVGDMVVIGGEARAAAAQPWRHKLYQPAGEPRKISFKAIPYYAWDNRKPGAMKVWLPSAPQPSKPGGLETEAAVAVSFANENSQPEAIHDGVEATKSSEQPAALCHWWPHRGTEEWAQYSWRQPVTINGTQVFWFDDTGHGECRLPASWRIDYLANGGWQPVPGVKRYPVGKDKWCEAKFDPITTTSVRLMIKLPENYAAGVHEWKVTEAE
ncbi:MAG TPA: beta-L-arabinofuranosidase domain-containing protein [Candidatus Dormibacteraeota bacterium]|nr:beta-L-arabinofuranosidase domain-containing protein [Candidatus Dormibacteraeota bacterium]